MGERAGWEAEGVSGEGVSRNREGKHMWKALQCGSGHSRSSRCVLLRRAVS